MKNRKIVRGFFVVLMVSALLLTACGRGASSTFVPTLDVEPVAPTDGPVSVPTALPTLTPIPPTPVERRISDSAPTLLRARIEGLNLPPEVALALDLQPPADVSKPYETQFQWVYALVSPFPTVRDDVTMDELRAAWEGDGHALLVAESTLMAFTALWGEPASGSVRSVAKDELLDTAWSESAWALVPFEELTPRWKVLTVDGQSPIRKGFDVSTYPLVVSFTLQSSANLQFSDFPTSNYDSGKLTTVILTGVTALVRATAFKMETKGLTYPGEDIRDILREADIAHISNEISFFTGCPYPNPNSGRLVFCSDPKYMELLLDVGMDVVEMTGNHFADYGRAAAEETIAIYNANNIPYFGGGLNLADSYEPATFDVNGNKIAFLGCNMPDVGGFKVAEETRPGATPCDLDYMSTKILELKDQGYVVIFTFQWYEDYAAAPNPDAVEDFRRVADAGADIVSGSQAHYAKMMEFYDDSFIHYGLGNLFFDQMGNFEWMPEGIRREFLDRYVIYDGKLVSVELVTAMLEDFARPRPMTDEERAAFLEEYFIHSGWTPVDGAETTIP